jgi:hypothetical protein
MLLEPRRAPATAKLRAQGERGTWLRLLDEIEALSGSACEFISHAERPWSSATFVGSRHRYTLGFTGQEAVDAGECLIESIGEHEFFVCGQLVADACVVSVEHRAAGLPSADAEMIVEVELLLLCE